MTDDKRREAVRAIDAETSEIVARIKALAARCDALEGSNAYLAAQLVEVNQAWRDAIAAIAAPDPETARSCGAIIRELAAQSSGLRQQMFSEMADILEKPADD